MRRYRTSGVLPSIEPIEGETDYLFVIKVNEEVNLVIQKIVHIAESYSTTMGVRNKLPFTVVNLRIHGWLTHALVLQHLEGNHLIILYFIKKD
ncbi:hypothetical protein [Gottfriedia acidiceleris]|uniref:hypothetical protein n=1 Tax=Gottfriedia acidiceleris TaxID=371036 RepID=UPI000B451F23|nr:hypothetical protein [Gottfriedia acidiceleris]